MPSRAYYEAHKAELAAYQRAWHAARPTYNRDYLRGHPGAYQRYAAKHSEYYKEKSRRFRQANPDYGRLWAQAHPAFVAAKNARRRSQLVGYVDPQAVFERDRWICQICLAAVDRTLSGRHRLGPTLDHVIPLSKGGAHSYKNCQLAHKACNSSKGARLPTPLGRSH